MDQDRPARGALDTGYRTRRGPAPAWRRGSDPAATKSDARKAKTVGELLDAYWADAVAGKILVRDGKPKKANTLASDKGRIAVCQSVR